MAVFRSALLGLTIALLVRHEALAAPSVKGPYSRTFYTHQQDYDEGNRRTNLQDSSELSEDFPEIGRNGVQSSVGSEKYYQPGTIENFVDHQQPSYYQETSRIFGQNYDLSKSGSYTGSGDNTNEVPANVDKNFQDAIVVKNIEEDGQNIKQEEEGDGVSTSWWNKGKNWIVNAPLEFFNGAHELGGAVVGGATDLWGKLTNKIDRIIQGVEYSAHFLQQHATDARSSDFLQKLKNKVETGNEEVAEFFQVLGDKISTWSQQPIEEDFTGHRVEGAQGQTIDIFQLGDVPDFFKDEEVQEQIEKLVAHGVIEQEEADLFNQQTTRLYN